MKAHVQNHWELRCVLEESEFSLTLSGPEEDRTRHHDLTMGSGDLTERLAGFFADVFLALHGADLHTSTTSWTRLWRAAEVARLTLASAPAVTIHEKALATIDGPPRSLELDLTKEKAEALLQPEMERFVAVMERFVAEENVTPARIILQTDAATLPQLAAAIQKRFHEIPEVESLTPAPGKAAPPPTPEATEPSAAPHPLVEMARDLLHNFHPDDQAEVKAALTAFIDAPTEEETFKAVEDLLFLIHGPTEYPGP